jgi:DNA-binding NtrC family response regulator
MEALNQIIVVEDDASDYELITHALERAGCQFQARRVDTQEDLDEELFRLAPDLVLCDHASARWNSFAILGQVRAFEASMPFVVVSGGLDDFTSEELRRKGVDDCVNKDALTELAPTVRRVLRLHDEQRRRRVDELRREVPALPAKRHRRTKVVNGHFRN